MAVPRKVNTLIVLYLLFVLAPPAHADGASTISVSATILSRNNCRFEPPRTATLSFGNLNPGNPVDIIRSTTLNFSCGGPDSISTFIITANNGNHFSVGSKRLQNTSSTGDYLPYELTLNPSSATINKTNSQELTIVGTVRGDNYRFAAPGSYTDQVVLSIVP